MTQLNITNLPNGTVFLGKVLIADSPYVTKGQLRVMKKSDKRYTYIRYGKKHHAWSIYNTQTDVEYLRTLDKKDFFKGTEGED